MLDPESMKISNIDPYHPLRIAYDEKRTASRMLFGSLYGLLEEVGCNRAILVGHNAAFDHGLYQGAGRAHRRSSPFHSFSNLDTVSSAP